jgi:hypothetical protein
VRRWLVVALALALAAMAGRSLLRFYDPGGPRERAAQPAPDAAHDEIDEASRQRLLEILRQEDEP